VAHQLGPTIAKLQELLNMGFVKMLASPRSDRCLTEIYGIKFWIDSPEEVLILKEVFAHDEYPKQVSGNFVFVDIGLNVGFTSLKFASDPNCKRIYGFEPFAPTLERAQENFELNPIFRDKISVYNYGLSDHHEHGSSSYNTAKRGQMKTIKGPAVETLDFPEESFIVKEASAVLESIFQEAKTDLLKIILKIDCEGAEYEILPHLDKQNLLKLVDQIFIEWHFKGSESLLEILRANQFQTREEACIDLWESTVSGMIHGLRAP